MRYIYALILMLAATGCASTVTRNEAPGLTSQATGLNAQQDRIIDAPILSDRKSLEALQDRLRKLSETGMSQNNYSLAKAQCWLDTAKTQYHENDRTGYIEESMDESQKIIQVLERNSTVKVGYETPLVARSTRLRDDLWTQLSKFKDNSAGMACNARTVACAEVRLVRAGHAEQQTGWRAATPHVMIAEDAIRRAAQEASSCAAPVVARAAQPVLAQAVTAVALPAPPAIIKETYVVLADTLFKFDKSGRDEMLPGGMQRLSAIASRLKLYLSIATLNVTGHTDRLGTSEYNGSLSARRAATVQSLLESMGVQANRAEAIGRGETEPVTSSCGDNLSRSQLISCLQPDRRVTIEVAGVAKQ